MGAARACTLTRTETAGIGIFFEISIEHLPALSWRYPGVALARRSVRERGIGGETFEGWILPGSRVGM